MAVDTFLDAPQTNLAGVARILVRAGRIEPKQAEDLTKAAQDKRSSFVAQLIETGTMKPLALAHALSNALAVPLLDLDAVDAKSLPQGIIDAKLIAQYRCYPLGKRGG
jgi:type IV pilus assembly protein PilB